MDTSSRSRWKGVDRPLHSSSACLSAAWGLPEPMSSLHLAGNKRSNAKPDELVGGEELDLGLGSDPLGGQALGAPLTQADLKDPDVAATLQDLWFGAGGERGSQDKKAEGRPGMP